MLRGVLFLSLLLSSKLLAITKIDDIKLDRISNGYNLIISFDSEYRGVIARKSGNLIQKIVINGAIAPKSFSKKIENSNILRKIDIFSFDNRTDIAFSTLERADINYHQIDDGRSIIISIVKAEEHNEKISPEGRSLFDGVSGGYVATLLILGAGVVALLVIKKKMAQQRLSGVLPEDSIDFSLDRTPDLSLRTIQPPNFELKVRKNPNSKRSESKKSKIDYTLNPNKKRTIFPNLGSKNEEEEMDNPKPKKKKTTSNKYVKVIFSEELDIGEISMIEVNSFQYLLLKEVESGNITILDKISLKQEKPSKKKEKKETEEKKKEESSQIAKLHQSSELDFDIKIPDEVAKNGKTSNDDELKTLFKDSQALKNSLDI